MPAGPVASRSEAARGVRLAVDAMGGDHGPSEGVPGALDHAAAHPEDRILLVGDPARIAALAPTLPPNVEVVPASQVIEMHEHPALALREKKDASITVACDLVRDGRADAILTAIRSGEYRLRWLVGKDALGLFRGRRRISDEAWVAMGDDLSDEEYNRRFAEYFGIHLR